MAAALSSPNIFNILESSEVYSNNSCMSNLLSYQSCLVLSSVCFFTHKNNHTVNSCFPVKYWGYHSTNIGGLQDLVKRLELSTNLECHEGCVNTVRWNHNGTKIVSGSDDTTLGIWEINCHYKMDSKLLSRFSTEHQSNIFHALFVPNTNDGTYIYIYTSIPNFAVFMSYI